MRLCSFVIAFPNCSLWEKRTARVPAAAGQPAFWVSVYPEAGQVFHRILSTAGEAACTKTSDLPLHYFPFDRDVLSMHRPEVIKELLTDSNPAALDETAQVRVDAMHQSHSHAHITYPYSLLIQAFKTSS